MKILLETNEFQTPITDELLERYPKEVQEQFFDYVNNVEFIKRLISPKRRRAKDMPRDNEGKIIVDLLNPHILEDMDYFRETALHKKKTGKYTDLRPNGNPNSDYMKWLRRETQRCWYGMVRPSDGEWITGDMYFYLNYMPIELTEKIEGQKKAVNRVTSTPKAWEGAYLWFHYVHQARYGGLYDWDGGKDAIQIATRGASKAHPYSEHVYTPEGIKAWGDIKVGDKLFGDDGNITTVTDIPFDGMSDIYELTLKDGRKITASDAHLWKVFKYGKPVVTSTIDIYNKFYTNRKSSDRNPKGIEYIYQLPLCNAVEYAEQEVSIDPYTFGLLLGDGSFRHPKSTLGCLTALETDMSIYADYIPYTYYRLKVGTEWRIEIPNLKEYLIKTDLYMKKSEDKYIPDDYIYNSKEVRKNILKGLLDSDGNIDNKGAYHISLSSKQLIKDIQTICRSLGYGCTLGKVRSTYYYSNGTKIKGKPSYPLYIYTDDILVNLPRKRELLKDKLTKYSRSKIDRVTIVNINYVGKEMAKCVTVDNSSHCYLINEFIVTHNSFSCASMLGKDFIVGENENYNKKVNAFILAAEKGTLSDKDGTLKKFEACADLNAELMQWPARRIYSSLDKMTWEMGYLDAETGLKKGTRNSVFGVTTNDNPEKARGSRAARIIYEEIGKFPKFQVAWTTNEPSVREGKETWGQQIGIGTGGSEGSNFYGILQMLYNPRGYNIYALPNIYDKNANGKGETVFFFGAYLNRGGFYNENGVSDVVATILDILMKRYTVKYNSTDPARLTQVVAERPLTIQEAIMRKESSLFPAAQLSDRKNELDANPNIYDDVYTGRMVIKNGKPDFVPSDVNVIREFPHKDNKLEGGIEIFQLPKKDSSGNVPYNRYIAGTDPVDDDDAKESLSLQSTFILDLWTDEIVAEYTGRPTFADDYYEQLRLLLMFYNARDNYENNKKGLFAYFNRMNSLYLLSDRLEYLKDKEITKVPGVGNNSKGYTANKFINSYGRLLYRNWLLTPVPIIQIVDGEQTEMMVPRLYTMKSRALIQESIQWESLGNYDRVSAMTALMLYREFMVIQYQGDFSQERVEANDKTYLGNDKFFSDNYDNRLYKGSQWAVRRQ